MKQVLGCTPSQTDNTPLCLCCPVFLNDFGSEVCFNLRRWDAVGALLHGRTLRRPRPSLKLQAIVYRLVMWVNLAPSPKHSSGTALVFQLCLDRPNASRAICEYRSEFVRGGFWAETNYRGPDGQTVRAPLRENLEKSYNLVHKIGRPCQGSHNKFSATLE